MHEVVLALELTLYGLLVVFGVLLLFLAVIVLLRRAFPYKTPQLEPMAEMAAPTVPIAAPVVTAPPPAMVVTEPRQVDLMNVDEPTAALIIAILAEQTGIEAGELNITSIRKVGTK